MKWESYIKIHTVVKSLDGVIMNALNGQKVEKEYIFKVIQIE